MAFRTGLLVMFIFFFRARTRVASLSFPLAQYQSVSTNVTCSSKNAESDQEHREKERKNIHSCCLSEAKQQSGGLSFLIPPRFLIPPLVFGSPQN